MKRKFGISTGMWLLATVFLIGIIPLIVFAADQNGQSPTIYLPLVAANLFNIVREPSSASAQQPFVTPPPNLTDLANTPVPFEQLPPCPDTVIPLTPTPDFSATGGCRAISTPLTGEGSIIISVPAPLVTGTTPAPVTPLPSSPYASTPVPFKQLPLCPDNVIPLPPMSDLSVTGGCRAVSIGVTGTHGSIVLPLPEATFTTNITEEYIFVPVPTESPVTPLPPVAGH